MSHFFSFWQRYGEVGGDKIWSLKDAYEKMQKESRETIINYMYSVIGIANASKDDLLKFRYLNIYDYLFLYNKNNENKVKYLNIIMSIAKHLKYKEGEEWSYIDLYHSLTKEINKNAMKKYLKDNMNNTNYEFFIDALENGDFLPF